MNLEAINKWLDEEYGCSYTRLLELHDFYFEKYCDLRKENKQLKSQWCKLKEYLNYQSERAVGEDEYVYDEIYNEMQEIGQGSDSNGQ